MEILSGKQVRQLERNISGEVAAALLAPSAGIVCPYELTLSALENAVENGKGVLVTPTADGNLLAGPTAEDVNDRDDDIILYFKKMSSERKLGYQTLLNSTLREYIHKHTLK